MILRKIAFILVVLCLINDCFAQKEPTVQKPQVVHQPDTFITANWKNVSIKKVKKEIEDSTDYVFWDSTGADFCVTLKLERMPLSNALAIIFNIPGYGCEIIGNNIVVKAKAANSYTVNGKVLNKKKEPVDATISIKGKNYTTTSDTTGKFSIRWNVDQFSIIITAVGYKHKEVKIWSEKQPVIIDLEDSVQNMPPVEFPAPKRSAPSQAHKDTVPDFYIDIPTGSKSIIDSSLRNWSASQNISDRLPTGIVLAHPNIINSAYQSPITIQSRITISSYPHALIILNGTVYLGDYSTINPNDVQKIEIVKDAAASTQYGLHAGNGVIIITTKRSAFNTQTKLTAIVNTIIGTNPDLSHVPLLSAADHIDITKALFDSGYYNNQLANSPASPISPIVTILQNKKQGLISAAEAKSLLYNLSQVNIKDEANKHLYRRSLNRQSHISIQGGTKKYNYNLSLGSDVARSELTGNSNTRYTGYLHHTILTGWKGTEVYNIINLTKNTFNKNGIDLYGLQTPYEKLTNELGFPLPVTATLNQPYKDSLNKIGKLLNWNYSPLDEIKLSNNKIINTAFHVTLGTKYHISDKLDVNAAYRHETESSENINQHSAETYFTRNIINTFSQIDAAGNVYRPVLPGSIIDRNIFKRNVDNIMVQVKYEVFKKNLNSLIVHTGTEIKHLKYANRTKREYGVTSAGPQATVDHNTYFQTPYDPGIINKIPNINDSINTTEHYYSYYLNAILAIEKRLQTSISFRKDESNIFGVQANLKGVPVFAVGASWDFKLKEKLLFSQLRLKISNGYCGNANRLVSSLTGLQSLGVNAWNAPTGMIVNPPNPWLSWEQVRISNIGLEFSLWKNQISGTVDLFVKQGTDLLGTSPIDPTSGVSVFQGNVAAMNGHGMEATIDTKFGSKKFQWQSITLMSYARDKVTTYNIKQPAIWYYCDLQYLNPIPGKPLFSMYSLPFKGLDPSNGDPEGLLGSQVTKNYNAILASPNLSDLIYHGPATPTFYGSFRNIITWKQFEFGFNMIWKAGYYIRTSSINYSAVAQGEAIGHADIARRWQHPGDEANTNTPSLRLPIDRSRELFYSYSSVLVEKGDHIRLQDIRAAYHVSSKLPGMRKCLRTDFYVYANNVGLLWKANSRGIDPDQVNNIGQPLLITIGTKIEL